MDKTPIYIKMCEKVMEIQNPWDRKMGDFFCESYWSNKEQKNLYDIRVINFDNQYLYQPRFIWLPRQDQLQGMVNEKNPCDLLHSFFTEVYEWVDGRYEYPKGYYEQFASMEQLWLVFVMFEKYNKIWDGEEWILQNQL